MPFGQFDRIGKGILWENFRLLCGKSYFVFPFTPVYVGVTALRSDGCDRLALTIYLFTRGNEGNDG